MRKWFIFIFIFMTLDQAALIPPALNGVNAIFEVAVIRAGVNGAGVNGAVFWVKKVKKAA